MPTAADLDLATDVRAAVPRVTSVMRNLKSWSSEADPRKQGL